MQKTEERENINIYRNVFRKIVESHTKKLLKREEFEKVIKIELDKRDDKNTDIENKNDSRKHDDENNFRHLKNNTFLKNDESEYESENYTDDESDDKKDSDDKNQVNDDFEIINN